MLTEVYIFAFFLGSRSQGTIDQLKTIGRELAMGSQGSSKDFLDLVKAIGEAKSKAEEERIVLAEIESLKRRIVEPDVPRKKMKEYIIRLVYVEMLGHDASFGFIHAVKMTHDDNLLCKKTGYLAVTLFLNDDHDLIILIVNTIQKDLKSDNYLVVCAALSAVCKLINEETIPAVLPQVVDLLAHPKEHVRKKAVMALHRFHQRSPESVSHLTPKLRQVVALDLVLISEWILGYRTYHHHFVGGVSQCKNAMFLVIFCCFSACSIEISAHFPSTLYRQVLVSLLVALSSFIPLCNLYELSLLLFSIFR